MRIPALSVSLVLALSSVSLRAEAEVLVGYQVGATQTVGTTISDDQQLFVPTTTVAAAASGPVTRLQGVQFTTQLTLNLTLDYLTGTIDHALLLGAGVTQLIPQAVPMDAMGALMNRITGIQGNASYLARVVRPRWSLALGGGYNLGSNGRLGTSDNGGLEGGGAGDTLPGSPLGPFVVNGVTHAANARAQLQILRERWDLDIAPQYTYQANGVFNLAPGVVGGQQAGQQAAGGQPAVGAGANLGAFINATTHNITPSIGYRVRRGRGTISTNLNANWLIPVTDTATTTTLGGIPIVVPETLATTGTGQYLHNLTENRTVGASAQATVGLRVPIDPALLMPSTDDGLRPDTFIVTLLLLYNDLFTSMGDLRLALSAGLAQPRIFQPPLGTPIPADMTLDDFEPVVANWQPVAALTLSRRFDPIDVTFGIGRAVGLGALGASAITTENANLTFRYVAELDRRRALALTAGLNAARTRAVGRELFVIAPNAPDGGGAAANPNANLIAIDNNSAGLTAGAQMPLFSTGDFTTDLTLAYNFNTIDQDPDNVLPPIGGAPDAPLGRPAITNHTLLFSLRAIFGRGPLQNAAAADADTRELDAFSRNPASDSPLTSARLIRQGAPLLDGTQGRRPGAPPETRRDSRQAYEERRIQEGAEKDAQDRSGAAAPSSSVEEERNEEKIEEKNGAKNDEKSEEKEEKARPPSRRFSEWPMNAKPL